MKMMRRILGMSLSALLLAGSLAGCATPDATDTPGPDATPSPTAAQSTPLVDTPDVVQQLLGFPRDTVIFTVNGKDVLAEDFLYCLSYATENVGAQLYGSASAIEWDGEVQGTPIKTYLVDSAVESAEFYSLIQSKAAEFGVTVSAEQQAELDAQLAAVIEQMGGAEAYAKRLQEVALSDEGFRRINTINPLYNGVQEYLFGENSQNAPTDDELATFAETVADALMAKHILILTQDDEGNDLPEEEQAAAKAKAEDLLAQLRASDDPMTLFDTLMNENSEDGRDAEGNLAAPDGYLFTAKQMVAEFETATRALEYNEISDLVKTSYGYHIILRLPPINDEVRSAWTSSQMSDQIDQWIAEAKLETSEEFNTVDPQTYYEKLTDLREALNPTPSATPAPAEPTESQPVAPTPTPAA